MVANIKPINLSSDPLKTKVTISALMGTTDKLLNVENQLAKTFLNMYGSQNVNNLFSEEYIVVILNLISFLFQLLRTYIRK